MLTLKTQVVHDMCIPVNGINNPAQMTLEWPRSPNVTTDPFLYSPVQVTTHLEQEAVIFPVSYLKHLIKLAFKSERLRDEDDRYGGEDFLLGMVDTFFRDQESIDLCVEHFNGARGHQTHEDFMKERRKLNEDYKDKVEEQTKDMTEEIMKSWLLCSYRNGELKHTNGNSKRESEDSNGGDTPK